MECLVCGKEYVGSECPRCRFPDVQIPGDRQKTIESLRPAIEAFRTQFLQSVKLEIAAFHWKDEDGTVVLDREERVLLVDGEELQQGPKWLDQEFARIPDEQWVHVTLYITVAGDTRQEQIMLPNIHTPQLQQIGVEMVESFGIRLLLRNAANEMTKSETIQL